MRQYINELVTNKTIYSYGETQIYLSLQNVGPSTLTYTINGVSTELLSGASFEGDASFSEIEINPVTQSTIIMKSYTEAMDVDNLKLEAQLENIETIIDNNLGSFSAIDKTIIDGYYSIGTGKAVLSGSSPWRSTVIDVTPEQIYKISINVNNAVTNGVIYATDDYTILSTELSGVTGETRRYIDYIVTIPDDCTKLILCSYYVSAILFDVSLLGFANSDISIIAPQKLYIYQDDVTLADTPPTTVYLDSFLTNKQGVLFSNGQDKKSLISDNTVAQSTNVLKSQFVCVLKGAGYNPKSFALNQICVKASSLSAKSAVVLQIGDSVTYGIGAQYNTDNRPNISWATMAFLGKKYLASYEQIGNNISESIDLYGGGTYTAKAEGHGGWSLDNYLFDATIDSANPFYDAEKTWTDTSLNFAGVKFSINKYITDLSLPTPTHIIIQLGFNDAESVFIDNMNLIIKAIKEELPNAFIGLSMPRDYGSWFNELYPDTVFNKYCNHGVLIEKLIGWLNDYMNLENIANKVYFIPNYFVTPTGDSIPTVEIDDRKVAFRADDGFHPNHKAHTEWGKQQFSWLAYTLTL